MKPAPFFLILFLSLLGLRICHMRILWAEEGLPMAAAAQMENGKALYREIWFDKPPLLAASYLLLGTHDGWTVRLAGALYALLACLLAYRFAGDLWGDHEARWAAALMAFFLAFDIPSAVTPLSADMLMLAPHLAAVYLAWRGNPFWAGCLAGLAFSVNSKGVFALAACALWSFQSLPALAAGFAAPNLALAGWLWSTHSLDAYYEQVWWWGSLYASKTFVANPVRNGVARTAAWVGFHAALTAPAAWAGIYESLRNRLKWLCWLALSFVGVSAGWRFFPRYFLLLLPAGVLLAARGACLLPKSARAVVMGLGLLVPAVRFGPRYFLLARDLVTGRQSEWVDTAIDRDSREAAALVRPMARASDTLQVWGFRSELYLYTGLPAASRFLDSQPLTGVPADRHLVESTSLTPELAAAHRLELSKTHPAFILDGLGPYNPKLAISAYPDLSSWLAGYQIAGGSPGVVIYRRRSSPGSSTP